jgi:hypothetical protein
VPCMLLDFSCCLRREDLCCLQGYMFASGIQTEKTGGE